MHRKAAFEHEVALGGKGLRVFLKHGIQLRTSTCPVDFVLQLVLANREVSARDNSKRLPHDIVFSRQCSACLVNNAKWDLAQSTSLLAVCCLRIVMKQRLSIEHILFNVPLNHHLLALQCLKRNLSLGNFEKRCGGVGETVITVECICRITTA